LRITDSELRFKNNALKLTNASIPFVLFLTMEARRHRFTQTPTVRPAARTLEYRFPRSTPGVIRMAFCAAILIVALAGCTGQGLSGDSNGWSPASVSGAVQVSQANISEGFPFTESDSTLTVSFPGEFSVGQTIVIDNEHLAVTSKAGNDLGVVRGTNGTTAQPHRDGTPVFILSEEALTIYVGTKQGEIKALTDDGFGPPSTKWIFRPLGPSQ
jgi:hypothetical protein